MHSKLAIDMFHMSASTKDSVVKSKIFGIDQSLYRPPYLLFRAYPTRWWVQAVRAPDV